MYLVALVKVPRSNLSIVSIKILENKNYFSPPASAALLVFFSVVSLDVELPHVLVIARPLEDGQPRVIDPSLASLRSLQDVLAIQLRGHVSRLGSSWQRSHILLHINLKMNSISNETNIVFDLSSHLSWDCEPGVWTGEVEAALSPVGHLRRPHAGLDTLLVAPHNLGSTQLPFARVSSSLKFELFKMMLTSINFLTGCVAWFCLLRMKSWRASSGGAAMDSSFLFRLWPA